MTDVNKYIELKKAVGEWIRQEKIRVSLDPDDTYKDELLYRKAREAGEAAEQKMHEIYEQMED